jgi:hypothetical protein
MTRKPYATDVSDDEWAFVSPYLALLPEEAGQQRHELREVFNGPRYRRFHLNGKGSSPDLSASAEYGGEAARG